MSLTLYTHPLASFCWKVLIALYENGTPFEQRLVDLGSPEASAEFRQLWPIARMPVLRDTARNQVLPETSVIIEYLALHYPGPERLVPADPDAALQVRLKDRFYDLYVSEPMQKIVTDRIRPEGRHDPHGVEQARALLRTAYDLIEQDMADGRRWATGDAFTLADCAALPALYYAHKVEPFRHSHPAAGAYLDRLMQRPSVIRVLAEAEPYFKFFPET